MNEDQTHAAANKFVSKSGYLQSAPNSLNRHRMIAHDLAGTNTWTGVQSADDSTSATLVSMSGLSVGNLLLVLRCTDKDMHSVSNILRKFFNSNWVHQHKQFLKGKLKTQEWKLESVKHGRRLQGWISQQWNSWEETAARGKPIVFWLDKMTVTLSQRSFTFPWHWMYKTTVCEWTDLRGVVYFCNTMCKAYCWQRTS